MRKLMVMATMLALMLAFASPAFADVTVTTGDTVEFNAVAQNIIGTVGDLTAVQVGTATATAADNSVAVATVDQLQSVSVVQANVVGNN